MDIELDTILLPTMHIRPTSFSEVFIVDSEPREDHRGYLARTFCEQEFSQAGLNCRWPQHNLTLTQGKGGVRGMHFQAPPFPETKLVRCLAGRIFDVAVDIRSDSPNYGKWVGCELSEENGRALYVPEGFAHGYQCLTEECRLYYLMSESYRPELARGFHCEDPEVGIDWPLPVGNLSERDASLMPLHQIGS